MRIRPMRADDVAAAERITARAFALPTPSASGSSGAPNSSPAGRAPLARERWMDRLRHMLAVDPAGCWVAADDDGVFGVAAALRRDLLWVLSTYAVDPDRQREGAGTALLEAAIDYGHGCLRGMLCALPNPAALRRYRGAGFSLYPAFKLVGTVDHHVIPEIDGVRAATDRDLDLVDSVDRQVRGATHRPDHAFMTRYGQLLVCDLFTGSGYAYLDGSAIALLAATNRSIAQRLLWAALAQTPPGEEVTVRYLTSDQEWALDVGLAAGLRVEMDGCLALRHMRPPVPYVPSVPFG
ncbi:GNAT family N-acetyltransferase [Phytoactinopolyspora halotolerans]|uniref:GNAT family N-acetyltransferase n=1 Tax=Phytoactinopolyspora halotolerans TaxID=1981512 RepID=A0A6L9S985_9ACTN|nr:GNAT family N-acetyltransferase [Phytoactinopolyspora halotolerans]NEE01776.1 GNAT family N-acetyltransferase [Phytoactinopolyspora halotolerans]